MSTIEVLLPDHATVISRIESTIQHTPEHLDNVLQEGGMIFEAALKEMVLTETLGSGLTAASIETRKEGTLEYGVGSYTRGHILMFLDRGTGIYSSRGSPILIQPVTRRALHFWIRETGDEVFASYCIVMGIIPFNWFERVIQSHLTELDDLMKKEVKM